MRTATPAEPQTIVAEVSRNYRDGQPVSGFTLAQLFEKVIATNEERGYALREWRLSSAGARNGAGEVIFNETIIATFERQERMH